MRFWPGSRSGINRAPHNLDRARRGRSRRDLAFQPASMGRGASRSIPRPTQRRGRRRKFEECSRAPDRFRPARLVQDARGAPFHIFSAHRRRCRRDAGTSRFHGRDPAPSLILLPGPTSPICAAGVGRTELSPTRSDPEGSSRNDFAPGRSGSHPSTSACATFPAFAGMRRGRRLGWRHGIRIP